MLYILRILKVSTFILRKCTIIFPFFPIFKNQRIEWEKLPAIRKISQALI